MKTQDHQIPLKPVKNMSKKLDAKPGYWLEKFSPGLHQQQDVYYQLQKQKKTQKIEQAEKDNILKYEKFKTSF